MTSQEIRPLYLGTVNGCEWWVYRSDQVIDQIKLYEEAKAREEARKAKKKGRGWPRVMESTNTR